MYQTPPTVPLPDRSAMRRPRTSFYAAVGCLSVIAGLLLGVGGFFGVRALQDGGGATVAEGEGGEGTPTTKGPTVLDETPVGSDSAVPLGSTFPIDSSALEGEVEVTLAAVDWDATAEMHEANSYNEEPQAGTKYILLSVDGVYLGDGYEGSSGSTWVDVAYVAEDGTGYERAFLVMPGYEDLLGQKGVAADGSFFSQYCFEVPADLEPGGHFVFDDYVPGGVNAGAWAEAA